MMEAPMNSKFLAGIAAVALMAAASAFAAPLSDSNRQDAQDRSQAETFNGVLPPGGEATIPFRHPNAPTLMHFRFYAPTANAGVGYALTYCIGPQSHPCGHRNFIIDVPMGQVRTATVQIPRNSVLVVGQGTTAPLPYSVEIWR
jgi:hypothetical protein